MVRWEWHGSKNHAGHIQAWMEYRASKANRDGKDQTMKKEEPLINSVRGSLSSLEENAS